MEFDRYAIDGVEVHCLRCGNDRFKKGRAQLNTTLMTLMNLDWANRRATLLICNRCSKIEW